MGRLITFCSATAAQRDPVESTRHNMRTLPRRSSVNSSAFGIFELEDDGTVIYSRSNILADADGSMAAIEGHNFFEEMDGFEDIAKCREHFKSFIDSRKATERFVWRCASKEGSMDTSVCMTRGYQTGYRMPSGVVMMEIRACQ